MKYLGVDYGLKKIGISISDLDGKIAFPKDILFVDKKQGNHIKYIQNIAKIENIKDIIIGKSLNLNGQDNPIEKDIKEFIHNLNKDNLFNIHRIDERFTTSMINSENRFNFQKKQNSKNFSKNAKTIRESTKKDDAKVAALILQNFLDSKSKI